MSMLTTKSAQALCQAATREASDLFSFFPKKKNCLTGTPYSSSESRKLASDRYRRNLGRQCRVIVRLCRFRRLNMPNPYDKEKDYSHWTSFGLGTHVFQENEQFIVLADLPGLKE